MSLAPVHQSLRTILQIIHRSALHIPLESRKRYSDNYVTGSRTERFSWPAGCRGRAVNIGLISIASLDSDHLDRLGLALPYFRST